MAVYSVVKFDGFSDRKWLLYRHPGSQITNKSKLIVGPGQVALVVHGGKIEKIYESGTYNVDSENFPFLEDLVKGIYGDNPYTVEVYFFNKTIKLDMLWGTKDPIQLIDPKYNVKVRARARGQYGLRVKNFQFVLSTLLGAVSGNNLMEFDKLADYLRGIINTKVKSVLSEYILKNKNSLMEISMYIEDISKACYEKLKEEFERFGLELINFFIETINVPEEDIEQLTEILNKKAEFDILGENQYRTVRGYDVLEAAANNEGAGGSLASAGLGLGIGAEAGKSFSNIINKPAEVAKQQDECPKCGKFSSGAQYCPHCGSPMKLTCPICNHVVSKDNKFCPECGTKMSW